MAEDVTSRTTLLGNPGSGTYGRNRWDLQVYGSKLYIGWGNSSNNGSPDAENVAHALHVYEPGVGFTTEGLSGTGTLDTTQIDQFRILDLGGAAGGGVQLCTPIHDCTGSNVQGFYGLRAGTWRKHAFASSIHTYDLATHDGKLIAGCNAVGWYLPLADIVDAGNESTWAFMPDNDLGVAQGLRAYAVAVVGGRAYYFETSDVNALATATRTFHAASDWSEVNWESTWTLGTLYPNTLLAEITATTSVGATPRRTTRFGTALVYVGAGVVDDHQWSPFGLYMADEDAPTTGIDDTTFERILHPLAGSGPTAFRPWDLWTDDPDSPTILRALWSYESGGHTVISIIETDDLVTWAERWRLTPALVSDTGYVADETFARSFEFLDSTCVVGLGSLTGTQPDNVGDILAFDTSGAVLEGTASLAVSASADLQGGAVAGSQYLKDAILNWLKDTDMPASPATIYVSLHTGDPGKTGASEVSASGTAYARVAVTTSSGWSEIANGTGNKRQMSNAGVITFPAPSGGNWGTVNYYGAWDTSSAGNHLFNGALDDSRVINDGDGAPAFAIGALIVDAD